MKEFNVVGLLKEACAPHFDLGKARPLVEDALKMLIEPVAESEIPSKEKQG